MRQGFTIDTIDAKGALLKSIFDSAPIDHNVFSFMPSPVSGTTFYAMPVFAPQQDTDVSAIYKADVSGGTPSAAVCNVHGALWTDAATTQLVYIDVGNSEVSLRSVPR